MAGDLDDTKVPGKASATGPAVPPEQAATRPVSTRPELAASPAAPPPDAVLASTIATPLADVESLRAAAERAAAQAQVESDLARTAPMERPPHLGRPARDGMTVIVPHLAALAAAGPAPAAPQGETPAAELDDEHGLRAKIEGISQKKVNVDGLERRLVKRQDLLKLLQELMGGAASMSDAERLEQIVQLRAQVDELKKRVTSPEAEAARAAETEKFRLEFERLLHEVERLTKLKTSLESELSSLADEVAKAHAELEGVRAELARERAAREAAEAGKAAAETARALLEERCGRLEGLLGASGKTVDELNAERASLLALCAELDERARSLRSDVRYAQLVEEPEFAEARAACVEVGRAAEKAPPRIGAEARHASERIAAAQAAGEPAWKKLLEDVHARRGTTQVVARLEVLSGVHDAMAGEIGRWRRALGE